MSSILKLDNIIPDDLCDECIEHYKKCNTIELVKLEYNNVTGSSTDTTLPRPLEIKIHEAFTPLIQKYIELNPYCECYSHTGYQIRQIHGATKQHVDGIYTSMESLYFRNVSIIAGLNSDFEEGVFNFPQQNYQTRLLRGQAIAFPVYFTHPHEVSSPIGYRYTINTWVIEKPRPFIPNQERM